MSQELRRSLNEKIEFHRETEFKDTEIGRIPKEWEGVKLKNIIIDIYYGITAKAVTHSTDLRMLRTTDIKNYKVDWDNLLYCEITEKKNDIKRFLLEKDDLVIARAGTTGVSVLVEEDLKDVIFGSYLIKVKLNKKVNPKFLHYFLQSKIYWNQIMSNQAGSTLKNIKLPTLLSLNIPLPPIQEQKKIAYIISSIDEAIQKTDELIAKTERFKKGVMKELLTKGIGHKEFKDTEIGRIPKEWEVNKLSDIVIKAKMGGTPRRDISEYWNGEIPFVKIQDITISGKYLYMAEEFITEKGLENSNAWIVPKDSLLLAIYGSVGSTSITKIPVTTNQAIVGIIPNSRVEDIEFLYYWYLYFKSHWYKFIKKGTQPNLTLEIVLDSLVPLPPLEEQKKIASILSSIDYDLEQLRKEREKLEKIKRGLMDELLSGRIRVRGLGQS
ncbi:MAG: restriction endonuclease subunit S [Thermoplasmata archaeon]